MKSDGEINKPLPPAIQRLADAMEKKGVKIKFGLEQQGHIDTIEKMLDEFGSATSEYIWEKIGKEIGWCHKTAAFYYIEYLRSKGKCVKAKYASERFAMMDVKRIKKRNEADGNPRKIPEYAYFCTICNLWHLTKQKQKGDEKSDKAIATLEEKIKTLNSEIDALKRLHSKEDKADRVLVKADARVKEIAGQVKKQNEIIKKLREDSEGLICKNIQLQKKIDQHEMDKDTTDTM
jgi:hypothetical protein